MLRVSGGPFARGAEFYCAQWRATGYFVWRGARTESVSRPRKVRARNYVLGPSICGARNEVMFSANILWLNARTISTVACTFAMQIIEFVLSFVRFAIRKFHVTRRPEFDCGQEYAARNLFGDAGRTEADERGRSLWQNCGVETLQASRKCLLAEPPPRFFFSGPHLRRQTSAGRA